MGLICCIICGIEEPTFERRFIYQNGILHVISTIAHDCNDRVLSIWHFFAIYVFHVSRFYQWYLTVVENNCRLVHPNGKVSVIYRARLATLSARERIARRRVVLYKVNQITHSSICERLVNLHMCVSVALVLIQVHCNERVLALATIYIINNRLFTEKSLHLGRVRLLFYAFV